MRVLIVNCPQNTFVQGCEAEVVGYDWVPWCDDASEKNPLVDLRLDSGHKESVRLSDCAPAGGWPAAVRA